MIRKTLALATVLTLCLGLAPTLWAAETYSIDNTHSSVSFKVRHFVGKVVGRFDDFDGTIVLDKDDLTKSSVQFTIQTTSVDTDNENRDNHLRTADFFDVEKFPTITFKSTKIEKSAEMKYAVTGDFTMRGVTKSIVIPVEVLGFGKGGRGNNTAGFEASVTIHRTDYGVNFNKVLEAGGLMLGEDVDVNITIEAGEQQPEKKE